jgi:RNA polymerase sigma-70 factor, ECF subfamily
VDADLDDATIRRLLEGDEQALREVIAAYGGVVLGMARRIVVEPSLAEEVAQDTFVALWRRPGAFDPERGTLRTFLLGMARNKAVDLVRREVSRRRSAEAVLVEAERASESMGGNESIGEIENREDLRAALGGLSRAQREAIFLAYFGGRTYREVAEELDIPEGTVKTRIRDGLHKLRRRLDTRGVND